jgi:hypothetical protein
MVVVLPVSLTLLSLAWLQSSSLFANVSTTSSAANPSSFLSTTSSSVDTTAVDSRAARLPRVVKERRPLRFWHVTDVHLNLWHIGDGDVRDMCRSATRLATAHPGAFGHFNCDPSKEVGLRIALERMRSAQSSPAFILLGGDDLGHIPKDREGSAAALASQRAVAAALAEVFPRVPILPTVGNHAAGAELARRAVWRAISGPAAAAARKPRLLCP